ncbi:hypothetical protein LQ757_12495 [Agromyces sp. SYSU K20354]|uniref:hypothetical protein n=1 Tax=Agromyces cavernae TaxID=2898659 RepID=UPI001E3331C4|nr:hypothetical protein [Agromyces cavernae]MCD2443094.1 hypothetical protein [Agromyces cavernae]
MPETLANRPSANLATLPGAAVLLRVRRLLVLALIMSLVYGFFTHVSKSYCPGGFSGDGGFVDADGRPTDVAPSCISLTLGPSWLVYAAIGVAVFMAITRVLKRAATEADALRILDRAAAFIGILAVASIVISHVWFALIPIDESGTGAFLFPFPFGAVTVDISPMTNG